MYHYKQNIGAVVRGLLNGLKHTPETAGPLIGVDPIVLEDTISGKIEFTDELKNKLISITGINERDFYTAEFADSFPVIDDTIEGIRVMKFSDTMQSKRTLARGPEKVPYYDYADTAMSNISTFRPEWIKELYVHDGESADGLPEWAFNKGHFEHQITYFIGPVNFYWIDQDGKRHVEKMNTGDTNYISPFVPHTFTTREEGKGLILAVTYGGAIADPIFKGSISKLPLEEYLSGVKTIIKDYIDDLDLSDFNGGVSIRKHYDAVKYGTDPLNLLLVENKSQPESKIFERIFSSSVGFFESTPKDRWVYNIGDTKVTLHWGEGKLCDIFPGDSIFIAPSTEHSFVVKDESMLDAKLLVVEIRPDGVDPYNELAVISEFSGDRGLSRVHTETTRWY